MFHGRFFSSDDQNLVPYVRELDARVALEFPEFLNGSAERRLCLVPNQITGRGVGLAAGASVTKDMPLAPYAGRVVLDGPPSDFVLALPSFRRAGRTWAPSVDPGALRLAVDPSPLNAALLDHACHNATVRLWRPSRLLDCALPCAFAFALGGHLDGCRLTWDYDGGTRAGNRAFTVDYVRSLELRDEGVATVPCACQPSRLCPRGRWFRVNPPPLAGHFVALGSPSASGPFAWPWWLLMSRDYSLNTPCNISWINHDFRFNYLIQ
jgi:hypothetical protein